LKDVAVTADTLHCQKTFELAEKAMAIQITQINKRQSNKTKLTSTLWDRV
jgi:hypothetical protein